MVKINFTTISIKSNTKFKTEIISSKGKNRRKRQNSYYDNLTKINKNFIKNLIQILPTTYSFPRFVAYSHFDSHLQPFEIAILTTSTTRIFFGYNSSSRNSNIRFSYIRFEIFCVMILYDVDLSEENSTIEEVNVQGRVFAPFWSENGYTLCLFWSGIGYGF